jgi:prepilin-type N-terminal cleavage/methylation domain-containing protein
MRQIVRPAPMRSSNGFTLIEMIVVVFILMILATLALPSYSQWRQNVAYRDTARHVMSELRQARSQAIASDTTQCVEFDAVNQQFGFSNTCATIINWTRIDLGSQVTISSIPTNTILFAPTGVVSSAQTSTVFILDSNGNQRFYVQVSQTGRILVQGPLR